MKEMLPLSCLLGLKEHNKYSTGKSYSENPSSVYSEQG